MKLLEVPDGIPVKLRGRGDEPSYEVVWRNGILCWFHGVEEPAGIFRSWFITDEWELLFNLE